MAQVALVSGFLVGVTRQFPKRVIKKEASFGAFKLMVDEGKAIVFKWNYHRHLTFLEAINPLIYLKIYKLEKKLTQNPLILKKFNLFLKKNNPQIIICHSLGCRLFLDYMKKYKLNPKLKKVIFVQADISYNFSLPQNISLINYFCFWDITLWVSLLLNRYLPAGIIGAKHYQNKFFPLYGKLNLHISSLHNHKFRMEIAP